MELRAVLNVEVSGCWLVHRDEPAADLASSEWDAGDGGWAPYEDQALAALDDGRVANPPGSRSPEATICSCTSARSSIHTPT